MKKNMLLIIPILIIILLLIIFIVPNKGLNFIKPHDDEDTRLADSPIYFNSSRVAYNNTNSGMSANTVQSAIEELYNGIVGDCYVGYTKGTTTSTQYTCNKNSAAASTTIDFSGLNVKYDNSSGLTAEDVQAAIDELAALVPYCSDGYNKQNETSSSYDCVINTQPSTLTVANNSINLTYGTGSDNSYSYNGDGTVSCTSSDTTKVTCSVDTTNNKITLTPVSVTSTAVTITVSATATANYYAPTDATFTVTVGAKALIANTPSCSNKTYNGNTTASCTITYNNVESGDSVTGGATCTFADANVGTGKTVTCSSFTKSGTGNGNYTVPSGNVTSTANITPAASTCPTTSNYSGSYDTSAHTINVTAAASGGTTYYRIDGGSWSTTNPSRTNAGTYTVDVKVVGDSNHSDNTSCTSRTITISRVSSTMSISPTSSGLIAVGSTTTTTITTNSDGEKSCTTSNSAIATCSISGNTVTITGVAPGDTTITVRQDQGTNYHGASKSYTAQIRIPYTSSAVICQRVTDSADLFKARCTQTSQYCKRHGYTNGYSDTSYITYGNAKALNTSLAVGDAFECDVNGNGFIDIDYNHQSTERFYYVSSYFNTQTKAFDSTYAVLIYYTNFVSGSASSSSSATRKYDSSGKNWNGPVTALTNLPTTSTWSNVTLKTTSRAILGENGNTHNATSTTGGTLPTAFSYSGYAARLLTAQEVMNGCGATTASVGTLPKECNFLVEGTRYETSSSSIDGPWLETPSSGGKEYAYCICSHSLGMEGNAVKESLCSVRPAIDVQVSKLLK